MSLLGACSSNSGVTDAQHSTDAATHGIDAAHRIDAAPTGFCDPVAQTGCPSTESCQWIHGDGTILTHPECATKGTIAVGRACTETSGEPDACLGGSVCRFGVCIPTCNSDAQNNCGTGYCNLNDQICALGCDPLGTSCPTGAACYPDLYTTPTGVGPGCDVAGTIVEGQNCDPSASTNQCAPGLTCLEGSTAQCRAICNPAGGGTPCGNGQVCVTPVNVTSYGICTPH